MSTDASLVTLNGPPFCFNSQEKNSSRTCVLSNSNTVSTYFAGLENGTRLLTLHLPVSTYFNKVWNISWLNQCSEPTIAIHHGNQETLSTIKDWDLLYQRYFCVVFDHCALQELLMKMNFKIAVAPPFVHPMTSLPAMPTHSVLKYGFFSEPTQWRQVANTAT